MAEIISFIAGCIFTLFLVAGCLFLSAKLVQFKEDAEIRREVKKKKLQPKTTPSGGVIKPKTYTEIENAANEELQAFTAILNDPGTE